MNKTFVRVIADVDCVWEGLPPTYRVFVNNELFAERTWDWTNSRLEEMLQIEAEPGKYLIKYELVPPHLAHLHASNLRIDYGPASIKNGTLLRIHDESQ
jgi:hypothetical protein